MKVSDWPSRVAARKLGKVPMLAGNVPPIEPAYRLHLSHYNFFPTVNRGDGECWSAGSLLPGLVLVSGAKLVHYGLV